MASESVKALHDGTQIVATGNGTLVDLPNRTRDLIAVLDATAIHANTTFDIKLQHSADKSNWYDLGSAFTQLVGVTGDEIVRITDSTLQYVRYSATLAGATQEATFTLNLHYDKQ